MKNKRKTIGNTVIIIGIALLFGAGGLFMYNMIESNNQAKEAGELVVYIKEEIKNVTSTETSGSGDDNNIEESRVNLIEPDEFVPVEINGIMYDGYLTIPAIELEMAVYDTWNDDLLRKSLCRYYGAPNTDDFIIAGHNYKSSFGKLKNLVAGDEVYFTDMNGNVTLYAVKQIEVIGGTEITRMLEGDWDLSLYTCTYGGSDRLTIRCGRVSD